MNVLLFMIVHSKLDSCFPLKVGEASRQSLPEARAAQHELCGTLCGDEIRSRDSARRDLLQNVQRLLGG